MRRPTDSGSRGRRPNEDDAAYAREWITFLQPQLDKTGECTMLLHFFNSRSLLVALEAPPAFCRSSWPLPRIHSGVGPLSPGGLRLLPSITGASSCASAASSEVGTRWNEVGHEGTEWTSNVCRYRCYIWNWAGLGGAPTRSGARHHRGEPHTGAMSSPRGTALRCLPRGTGRLRLRGSLAPS